MSGIRTQRVPGKPHVVKFRYGWFLMVLEGAISYGTTVRELIGNEKKHRALLKLAYGD